jgi:hypothetical protein
MAAGAATPHCKHPEKSSLGNETKCTSCGQKWIDGIPVQAVPEGVSGKRSAAPTPEAESAKTKSKAAKAAEKEAVKASAKAAAEKNALAIKADALAIKGHEESVTAADKCRVLFRKVNEVIKENQPHIIAVRDWFTRHKHKEDGLKSWARSQRSTSGRTPSGA